MSGVQAQVKSVDKEDRAKLGAAKGRKPVDTEAEAEEVEEVDSEDELEKVGMKAEDILACVFRFSSHCRRADAVSSAVSQRRRSLSAVANSTRSTTPRSTTSRSGKPSTTLRPKSSSSRPRKSRRCASRWTASRYAERTRRSRSPNGVTVAFRRPGASLSPRLPGTFSLTTYRSIEVIKGLGYTAPTSIQSQAIPAIMSGRDIIGVAKTGSGKTMAFITPMFRHIKDQRPIRSMEGPIAMIMTPTRELATQIHKECKPFLKALGLRVRLRFSVLRASS